MSDVIKSAEISATIDMDASKVEDATEAVHDLGEALDAIGVPRVTFRNLRDCTITVNVHPTMTMMGCGGCDG